MKTTVEVSDALMERARQAAREQGIHLRDLFERGLQLALQPAAERFSQPTWSDLSFRPQRPGVLVEADQWRDLSNQAPGWQMEMG